MTVIAESRDTHSLAGGQGVNEPPSVPGLPEPLCAPLVTGLGRAHLFARRVLGDATLAEDAVQEACLRYIRRPPLVEGSAEAESYFLRVVHGASVNLLKSERARARREEKVMEQQLEAATAPDRQVLDRETLRAARAEIERMPRELREAVCLCCEAGLTHREAAEIVGVPLKTMSDRVGRALGRLRKALAASGFAAVASGALAEALAPGGPADAPAHLVGAVRRLIEEVPAGKPVAVGGSSAALKGGLIVKIGLGIATVGLVAGTTFLAIGGRSGEPASPPAAAKVPGKDYPYGEGVVYKREYAAIGSFRGGIQDGPGAEMEISGDTPRAMAPNGDWYFLGQEKDLVIMRYDARKKRASVIAWSGPVGKRGGPAECARFAGGGYACGMGLGVDPTGKYLIVGDANNNGYQWKMDLEKFIVEPTSGAEAVKGSAVRGAAPDGAYYFAKDDGKLRKVSPDGKTVQDLGVQLDRPLLLPSGRGNLLVDEKLGRLWTMTRDPFSPWGIVWYWDLKTGKATGVTGAKKDKDGRYVLCDGSPATKDGTSPEYHCSSGPAGKTTFWCASGMTFGPDRGERYVYLGGGDESTCTRIDHVKGYVTKLVKADPKDRSLWTFGEGRQGKDVNFNDPYNWAPCPHWGPDGEFYMAWALASAIDVYRPVQK
jgi:RNA polymerase sigma-70 factor (ECF subfamily)